MRLEHDRLKMGRCRAERNTWSCPWGQFVPKHGAGFAPGYPLTTLHLRKRCRRCGPFQHTLFEYADLQGIVLAQ